MRKLKLFFACLLMAVLSIGQVWAAETAVTVSANPTTSGTFTISAAKSTGSNAPIVTGGYVRCYANNVITISTSGSANMTGMTIAWTKNGSKTFASVTASTGTYSHPSAAGNGTWSGSAKSVDFTVGASGQIQITSVTITTEDGGGSSDPTLTVEPATIDFGTVDQNAVVASKTVAVTFANLTGSVTYSGLSGAFSASGSISATGDEITIAANTATIGNYSQTLTVQSAADSKSQDVTVKMNVVEPFDGLKLTFDVSSNPGEWPTANSTTTTNYTYTLNAVDYTFALNNVKCNSGYLMLTSVAKLGLPAISGYKLVKVEATNSSGCSTTTQVSVSSSDATKTDVTGGTAQTWGTTSTKYTYNLSGTEENTMYYLWIANKNCQLVELTLYYEEVEAATVATPVISGDENFVTSTTVTLDCSTTGADIYYTTDGTDPKSGTTGTSFSLTETATVRAIAKLGSDWSAEATKTFTKVTPKTTAAELRSFATSSAQNAYIQLDGWKVTFVSGNNAYIIDPSNEGVILNNAGHGYVAGDELNDEVVEASVKLASGRVQLSGFTSTDITATSGTVSPVEVTDFSTILAANQSRLITLKDATYASADGTFSDGTNTIYYYDQFSASPTLVDGTTYDVTGIVIYYKNNTTEKVQIAPRTSDDVEAQSPVVIPTAANLAALKAAARGTYILTLENAVVSYVNGKNAFIEDATGGALIYFQDHGFTAGDCLNGEYQVTTEDYQGKFEITAMEPQTGAAKTTAEIPLTTVSIATLNASFSSYESRRVKIVGANVTDAISGSDRNGAINDGAALAVYAAVASTITLTADDNVDIIGYPGFHNTDQQLNVWRQEDITVNVKEDPELAYKPTVVNVLLSDLASFTPAVLEYATGFDGVAAITYESSDPSIATVGETTGVVEVVATAEGSATITASFPGNPTYKVDNASYTINVSATPIVPVYTMSFDFTRASYDDAADEAVVWNSSVATITATKGTGTKVTNYLAGNYSGTTLIAETRLYANNSLGFEAKTGASITKVEVTMTAASYASALAGYDWTNASAEVSSTNNKVVVITPTAATFSAALGGQIRIAQVAVYYTAESEKSKLTASIAIDDMNMAVGDDDILLSAIAATSNPNKKAISYAVTSGSEYVSITGEGAEAALHAIAEGTATVTATIPNDLGNYTGATTTFDIVVAAAPAALVSIAISGTATELEYNEGDHFDPAGLKVMGHYSDNSDAEITEGIDWAFDPDPLTEGTTSVSVTATVGEISSDAVVVNGLTVAAAPAPTSKKVVIIAEFESKLYAMSNTVASKACAAIEVEKDGSNLVVSSTEDKAAVQWLMTTSGDDVTLQDADDNYLSASSGDLSVAVASANWSLTQDGGYYLISMASGRALMYRNTNVFKHYSTGNTDGYAKVSEIFEVAEGATNIVISSKVDPELAYTPASDEITVGDAWSAPTLGYVEGFDGLAAITYESSNEAVATVTDAGVIALAGGTGTATITATFGGNANYLADNATYAITVNAPAPTPTGTTYTKVTSTAGITDGEYLIVYETTSVAFNGALETLDAEGNSVAVVISGDEIAGTTAIDAAVFTIDVTAGTLQSASGKYIGVSSNSNGLKQTEDASTYTHTFSIDGDGNAVILANFESSTMKLRYNPSTSAGNLRFRYYKNDGQQAIQLYKKETPEPAYTEVRSGLEAGRHYTVCLEKNVTAVKGATFWSLTYKNAAGTEAYLVKEEAPFAAGKPYIFQATGDNEGKLEVVYGEEVAGSAGINGALVGTFSYLDAAALNTINETGENEVYMLFNNELRPIGTDNHLDAHRAYVLYNLLTPASPSSFAPGKTVKGMPMHRDAATGFENIESGDAPMKVMIEGTLYILRGEKVYDATGRLVK